MRVRALRGIHWTRATVAVTGRATRTLKPPKVTKALRVTGLRGASVRVTITAKARGHRRLSLTRSYRFCAPAPTPTPTAAPTSTPVSQPAPAPAQPGSYTGPVSVSGSAVTFYISADGRHVQDVSTVIGMSCTGGSGVFNERFTIDDIPIAADGAFSATVTRDGITGGAPATYSFTFAGQANGTTGAGTIREDLTYDDGTVHHCTSDDHQWSAARDAQGAPDAVPPAGSYEGSAGGAALAFYISRDGQHVQDVTLVTGVVCVGGLGTSNTRYSFDDIPIAADGSFSATVTGDGIVSGQPATFTYTFSGHAHGTNAAEAARLAGSLREEIDYGTGTVHHHCSTNLQPWEATRDQQGPQTIVTPPNGNYAGSAGGAGLSFTVSGSHAVNVGAILGLFCLGGTGQVNQTFTLADVPIAADGSLAADASTTGTLSGYPATFRYVLVGHTHGTTLAGKARLSGTLHADVTYDDGAVEHCTTNTQPWSATLS